MKQWLVLLMHESSITMAIVAKPIYGPYTFSFEVSVVFYAGANGGQGHEDADQKADEGPSMVWQQLQTLVNEPLQVLIFTN